MLDIYKLGDDVLKTKCEEVKEFDNSLEILVDAMFDTLEDADGVGLAGPQVGVEKRLFIVSIPNEGIQQAFVNPQIVETSYETGPYDEGCLSLPGVYHTVTRPLSVTVMAKDEKGKSFTVKAEGLYARVIQHEYDHLDGKLFIDRLTEEERQEVIEKYLRLKKRTVKAKRRR